jgi:hypothetical protein
VIVQALDSQALTAIFPFVSVLVYMESALDQTLAIAQVLDMLVPFVNFLNVIHHV